MIEREKVIKGLKKCKHCECDDCTEKGASQAPWDCPAYDDFVDSAIALLEEQEPKTGHWIFESRYYDAWSNICSECGRLLTTAVGTYANFCSNCGAKMTGDDSIGSEIPNS